MIFYGPNKKDLTEDQVKASIEGYEYVISRSMPDTNCKDQAEESLKLMQDKLAVMESENE